MNRSVVLCNLQIDACAIHGGAGLWLGWNERPTLERNWAVASIDALDVVTGKWRSLLRGWIVFM
jgi:hypothetical protein